MKAIQLVKHGDAQSAFKPTQIDIPEIGSSDVLIKCEGFGLNYADVLARLGMYREAPPLPSVLGYEVVGKIEKVGKKVNHDLIGKRVVGFTRFGGYAEYAVTSDQGIGILPDNCSLVEGVAYGTQFVTAYYAAIISANVQKGERVLIHAGAGGVGSALIQLCKAKNAEIVALASTQEKLDLCNNLGADYVINYVEKDYEVELEKLFGSKCIDVSFNSTAGASFKKDNRLLNHSGRLVMYGASSRSGKRFGLLSTLNMLRKMGVVIPIGLMMSSKSLIGINMLKIADSKPQIIKRCLDGIMKLAYEGILKPVVGGEFNASEISKAHELLEKRKTTGKIGIRW